MIFKCKIVLICLIILNCGDFFEQKPVSKIPDNEAAIIRNILRANEIDIKDNEWVDEYLRIDPFYHEVGPNETYFILLPKTNHSFVCLTDDISELTHLSMRFNGIDRNPECDAETLIIKTDSVINIRILSVGGKLSSVSKEIKFLRSRSLGINYNKLKTLPIEIMEISSPPHIHETVNINISGNSIDTTTISDTLDKWLQKYSSPYWKNLQVYE